MRFKSRGHAVAVKQGHDRYRRQLANRRLMIAKAIEALNPADYGRGNMEIREQLAGRFSVSSRTIDHVWKHVVKHRCPCCGTIVLPADFEVPAMTNGPARPRPVDDAPR